MSEFNNMLYDINKIWNKMYIIYKKYNRKDDNCEFYIKKWKEKIKKRIDDPFDHLNELLRYYRCLKEYYEIKLYNDSINHDIQIHER